MRKSLLKTMVATAIVGAVMTVSSVVAMAATNTYYYVEETTKINTENFFTVTGGGASGNSLTDSFSFSGEDDTYTPATNVKLDSKGKVEFETSGVSTVEVIYGLRTGKSTTTIALDSSQTATATDATKYYTKTFTDVEAGKHVINKSAGDEGRIYGVKVVDVVSDDANDYTVSGTTNLTETTFTVGSETVTSDADGNWSFTKTAESSPFAVGDTFAVSLDGYTAEPSSVTLAAGSDDYSFTAGEIIFTELTLSELTKGKFYTSAEIAAGLPNFNVASVNWNDRSNCRVNTGSSIKFISPVDGFMVLNGKSGSSSKAVALAIGENNVTVPNNQVNNYVLPVVAGENTLNINEGEGGSTSLYINSIVIAEKIADTLQASPKGTDYYCVDAAATYIIHPVSDKEMDYASIAMADADGNAIEATKSTSVYASVKFSDTSVVEAADCGEGVEYIYAIKVTGTNGAAPTQKYTWVDGE